MPKKIKKTGNPGLFSCIKAPLEQEEMLISEPNTLNDLETQIIEEVKQKIAMIEKLEKTYEQQHLLALMKSIKKFSKKENTFETIDILKGMIAMYKEKKIDWNKFLPIPPIPPAIPLIVPVQTHNSVEISFQQQLLEAKEKLEKNKKEIPEQTQTTKQGRDHAAFLTTPVDFNRNRLNSIRKNQVILNEEELSEFAQTFNKFQEKKLKKQQEENSVNTEVSPTINNDVGLPQAAIQLTEKLQPYLTEEDFDNLEYILNEKNSEALLNEKTIQEIGSIYFYKAICTILQDLKRYISPEKFNELKKEIAIKHSKNQLDVDEETFQKIEDIYDRSLRPLSIVVEGKERVSLFNPVKTLPRIVGEIPKPIQKM